MLDVVAHPLFEVGIVGPDLDVVVTGDVLMINYYKTKNDEF